MYGELGDHRPSPNPEPDAAMTRTTLPRLLASLTLTLVYGLTAVAGDVRETTHDADDLFPKTRRLTPHVDGKPHGLVKAYDAKDRLVFTEHYVRGELNGDRTAYRPDGTKFSVMPFVNGKFHGPSTGWFPDGTVSATFEWKEGKPHGTVTLYYRTGKVREVTRYVEGKLHGPYVKYTPDGEVWRVGEAANGKTATEKFPIPSVTPAMVERWDRDCMQGGLRELWEAEWTPLFNGKDLTGWKTGSDPKKQAIWTVRDGILRGEGNETFGFLYTEAGDYENFHLRVEARVNAVGNSGVSFHVPNAAEFDKFVPAGMEAQIAVNGSAKTGGLYLGSSAIRAVKDAPHAADEWFTLEVIVKDGLARVLVNGKQTAEAPLDARAAKKGLIGLQKHSIKDTVVEFRKIEVRRLPASPTPKAPPAPQPLRK